MGEDLTSLIRDRFGYAETGPKQYSPLALAFVGDAVYSLLIRTKLLCERERTVNHLHKHAADEVKAATIVFAQQSINGVADLVGEEHLSSVFLQDKSCTNLVPIIIGVFQLIFLRTAEVARVGFGQKS